MKPPTPTPPPPPPPPPEPADAGVVEAGQRERRRAALSRTIMTGPGGLGSSRTTGKSLLGQ